MALRALLVALVACLGLELPGVDELSGWKQVGQAWVSARMDGLASLRGDFERSPAQDLPAESRRGDRIEAVSGRVDLAFEVVVDGMASGFSADLASVNRMPEEPPAAEAPIAVPPPRLDRITAAVRLTRQAVDAWASVILPAGEQPTDSDSL